MRKHKIQKGETLSKIAATYQFESYHPIWIYNSRIHNRLTSQNPDKIGENVEILIPKTAQQYEESLKRLVALKVSVRDDFQEISSDLKGAKRETDAFGDKIDLAADLAMIGKGAVKASVKIGSKRLRNYVLKKKSLEAAQKLAMAAMPNDGGTDIMVIDKAGAAAVDNSIMVMAKQNFNSARAKDKFAKGMAQGMAKKGAVMITKSVAPVEHANGIAGIVSSIAEVLIGGMDAIKPTAVAKTWIWATTGEHPDDVYDKAQKHIAKQSQNSIKRLEETIAKLKQEQGLLYP